jgi:hypothetical protein
MMDSYFYTVALCENCAYRLELLAACAGSDDISSFAAMALSRGLAELENDHRRDAEAALERRATKPRRKPRHARDLDDDFPF